MTNKTNRIEYIILAKSTFFLLVVAILFMANSVRASAYEGSGTQENPYLIYTKDDLYNVRMDSDAQYRLENDIIFTEADFTTDGSYYNNGHGFTSIPVFSGVFDGNGHMISGFYQSVSSSANTYAGLFGRLTNGTVKNLKMNDIDITAKCTTSNYAYAGGIAGYVTGGNITNCSTSGYIKAYAGSYDEYAGGIVGALYNDSVIENCYNTGIVYSKGTGSNYSGTAGGIAGYCYGQNRIEKCSNAGNIKGGDTAGGIAGYMEKGAVKNEDGEIVGNFEIGTCIDNCFNTAIINGNGSYAGGIVGYTMDRVAVKNSYNLTGMQDINSGSIVGTTSYHQGDSSCTIENCYSLKGFNLYGKDRSGTLLTIDEFKDSANFAGFDFNTVWTMEGNGDYFYPELKENGVSAYLPASSMIESGTAFPSAPQTISAAPKTYNGISLVWTKVNNTSGYYIYRSDPMTTYIYSGSGLYNNQLFSLIGTVTGEDTISYTDSNAAPGVSYVYKIIPYKTDGVNFKGLSGFSNVANVVQTSYDKIGPVLDTVDVQTEKVLKPGIVSVKVSATDSYSGLASISVSIDGYTKKVTLNGEKSYNGIINIPIPSQAKTGSYQLGSITLTDKSGNSHTYDGNQLDSSYVAINKEFDIEFEGTLSNPYVTTEITNMAEGKTVLLNIDPESNGMMKKELFDAIKGKDKTIVVYCDEAGSSQWVINGLDIVNETKNIDLRVKISMIYGDSFGTTRKLIQIDFAENGVLPGKINFRIKSDYAYDQYELSDKLYLYYLNSSVVSLEHNDFDVVLDNTDHWCRFDITHNSTFLISGRALQNPDVNRTKPSLSTSVYTYTGIAKTPAVTIRGLVKNRDFTVSYKNNINPGYGTVTITGKGNYRGTITKQFLIQPKRMVLSSVQSLSRGTITTNWLRDSKVSGYELQYSGRSSFASGVGKITITGNTMVSKKIYNLTRGKTYYVRIRSYKISNSKKIYGAYSTIKYMKVK